MLKQTEIKGGNGAKWGTIMHNSVSLWTSGEGRRKDDRKAFRFYTKHNRNVSNKIKKSDEG